MAPVIGPNFNAHAPRRAKRAKAAPAPTPGVNEIPSDLTTVKGLTAWVGEDKDRAQIVLAAETSDVGENRTTLVSAMETLLAPEPEPEPTPETTEEGSEEPETEPTPEPEAEVVEEPEIALEAIPEGMTKVKDLETWVGTDVAKARAVLTAEAAKPEAEQRTTLVSKMTALVSADGSDLI